MSKNVLMLLNAPYPSDIRVKKEADALIRAGFGVFLLCRRKSGESTTEEFEGIRITRIDAGKNNYVLAFWDVIMSINFIHPKFESAARTLLQREDISAVHVHDLPLAGTALKLKKELGVKIIVDFHENYPEALRTWFKWKKNPIVRLKNSLFLNPERWLKFEKIASDGADHVIAVVEEMKARLIDQHGTASAKITVVTNTEEKTFVGQTLNPAIYGSLQSKFILTYSGGIGPHRGVDIAIRGMQHLRSIPEIQLAVVGFGSSSVMSSLMSLTKSLQLENVHFLGYQPFSKFYSYMHFASVNIIPHQSNLHTDNTVPHKLFQGMMAGRPLLVSSSAPLKRLTEKYEAGLVFNAGDDVDFAGKVKILFDSPELRDQLAKHGTEATLQGNLNWETTQRELIHLYQSI